MTLLDELKKETTTRRQSAVATYRQLLRRADSPQPGDSTAMGEVMAVLGIGAEDVQSDLDALGKAVRLRDEVLTPGEGEELKRRRDDELEACRREYRGHMKQFIDKLADHQLGHFYEQLLIATTNLAERADGPNVGTGRAIGLRMLNANLALTNASENSRRALSELEALKREHALAFRGDE